ncbi:hypothetical protein BKA70DRAFT_480730 [Coprinopsis sp. MPI-PUGE-AT-0042]|nr:hypothetical protein BKA70DRAFT_480730 [Coprinopsis sp. MPI-PUGE-AT-0042]
MGLLQTIRRLLHLPGSQPKGNLHNVTQVLPITADNNNPQVKDTTTKDKDTNTGNPPAFFSEHSPMWRLYLEGASAEAKASADLCQTAIDSLLIFAGLFGSVLASFIVDSSSKLTPDADQFILADIRSLLQSGAPAEYTPDPLIAWINGLWFTSLLLTLFAAILGGIAKSWFMKFATPTRQQEADDAYRRWVLDLRRWYLERVIAIMPLVLHMSLLLFAAGFGLQAHGDNPTLGWYTLALVALGIIVYVVLTMLSIWNQRVLLPLNTPLTDLLVGINELVHHHSPQHAIDKDPYLPGGPQTFTFDEDKDKDNVLALICQKHILWSSNPLHVDTAVIEILPLPDHWLAYFIQHGVAERSMERIKTCMETSARPEDEQMRNHTLRNHLKALIAFRAWNERQKLAGDTEITRKLSQALEGFVCGFLGRWNTLPEAVRPLVFGIRASVFPDVKDPGPLDFHAEETEDLSWEIIHKHSAHSSQRLTFALAACCGIWADSRKVPRLQETCLLSLCLSTVFTVHSGQTSEWQDENSRDVVRIQGKTQLRQSFGLIVFKCEKILLQHLKDFHYDRFGFAGTHEGSKESAFPVGTVVDLAVAFVHRDPSIRKREVKNAHALIEHLSRDGHAEHYLPFQSALLHMALNDDDKDVRETCRDCLNKMYGNGTTKYRWSFTDSLERPNNNYFQVVISTPLKDWENEQLDDLKHVLIHQIPPLLKWIDTPMELLVNVILPLTIMSPHTRIRDAGRLCLKACFDELSSDSDKEKLKEYVRQALRDRVSEEPKKGAVMPGALRVLEELDKFDDMGLGLNAVDECLPSAVDIALNCRGNCSLCSESCNAICPNGDCPSAQRTRFSTIFEKWAANTRTAANFGQLLEEKITRVPADKFVAQKDAIDIAIYWIDLLQYLAVKAR